MFTILPGPGGLPAAPVWASDGTVDPAFDPGSGVRIAATVSRLARLNDGSFLAVGTMGDNPATQTGLAHISAAGDINAAFDVQVRGIAIKAIVQRGDGAIVLGGQFSQVNAIARANLALLTPTGVLAQEFQGATNGQVYALAVQADGKLLVGGEFGQVNQAARPYLARLNSNGSLDTSFNPVLDGPVHTLLLQPDGKILVGGAFSQVGGTPRHGLARLSTAGALDPGFIPDFTTGTQVGSLMLQTEDRIVVAGELRVADAPRYLAQLSAAGALDPSFAVQLDRPVLALLPAFSGRFYIGGEFSQVNGGAQRYLARLLDDGRVDGNFSTPQIEHIFFRVKIEALAPNAAGTPVAGGSFTYVQGGPYDLFGIDQYQGLAEFSTSGFVGEGFRPPLYSAGQVDVLAPLADGRMLIGGFFSNVGGRLRFGLAQLNADGSINSSYPQVDGSVNGVAVQSDGEVIIAGSFQTVFNSLVRNTRRGLARLRNGGQLDMDYIPQITGLIYDVAIQPDDKLLVNYYSYADPPGHRLIRLEVDGDIDPGFSVSVDQQIDQIIVQPDGTILISGYFSTVNGEARSGLARLSPAGAVDPSFQFASAPNSAIWSLLRQGDGKLLIGGVFTQAGGTLAHGLARLNADGGRDIGFVPPAGIFPRSLALQKDGGVLVASEQNLGDGRLETNILRFGRDGALDSRMSAVANGFVMQLVEQNDGKVLLAGSFTRVNTTARVGVARLLPDSRPPESITITANAIAENRARGSLVGQLSVVGTDGEEPFVFGFGTGQDNGFFTLSSAGELRTNAVFDYEQRSSYSIRVRALRGALIIDQLLIIKVIDRPEAPPLASTNGTTGRPGSAFGFTAGGFTPGARVRIQVTPPAGAQVGLAQSGAPYLAGNVTADASGTIAFAVLLNSVARPGVYTVAASAGDLVVSAQVTLDRAAPVLTAPTGVAVVRGQPTIFLPLLLR